MEFQRLKFIGVTSFWLLIATSSLAANPPHLLQKSLGLKNDQKIWTLSNEDQADIRYDSNGDKEIDEWLLVKDNLKINIYFANHQISKVRFSLKKESIYLQALYVNDNNIFMLQNTWAISKPISFMATPTEPTYTPVASLGAENNICPYARDPKPLSSIELSAITNSSQVTSNHKRWDAAIDSSCVSAKEPIRGALRDVFDLPALPKNQKNNFLECLSSNPSTEILVTGFTNLTLDGPDTNIIGRIECKKINSQDCGKASYKSAKGVINLPFADPACSRDMRSIYRQQVFHESLHSLNECLSEETIVKIIGVCETTKGPLSPDSDVNKSIKADYEKCAGLVGGAKGKIENVATPQAQTQNSIAESAQLKVTNIPKSLAEGSLAIPAPEPQTPGMVALNNSFQESRAPASASVTIPLQQSIAMSAPFFKAAAKVFSNYKLEPMQGQAPITTQLASQKTPRAVAAPVNAEISKPTTSTSAEPASFAKADNSKPSIAENSEPNTSPTASTAQSPTGTRSPEVGTSGARGIASAPSTNPSTTAAAKPRVSDDASIDQERAKVAQNLVKMSIPQAREYIKSNELNLERLKILILSQKNQRWGYKDPSRAAVLIQEVNGQLRIESQ